MFYAHFVLSKKGPLAKIWLAAHWDKKLTKAHVFETNIEGSVEAIIQPKAKLALRTSGHLLLGVVRIYSRKAKYLLADCNEAFVKIKMAFRPGMVDLPEENREAALSAITLPEAFHEFDTAMADLSELEVQAQFAVNQSRPEEITMREDLGSITLIGDDGFGDMGFDSGLLDDSQLEESLFSREPTDFATLAMMAMKEKDAEMEGIGKEDVLISNMEEDHYEGPAEADDDYDSNDGGRFSPAADGEAELFVDPVGAEGEHEVAGLFEDPVNNEEDASGSLPNQTEPSQPAPFLSPTHDQSEKLQIENPAAFSSDPLMPQLDKEVPTIGQSSLNQPPANEPETFTLKPIDIMVAGPERKYRKKRKLIVDEQKAIASETMKLQLSDTSDIVTTLDLAPPTKKLMHWKETGGVDKLTIMPGRPLVSKKLFKLFSSSLVAKQISENESVAEKGKMDDLDILPEEKRSEEMEVRNTVGADGMPRLVFAVKKHAITSTPTHEPPQQPSFKVPPSPSVHRESVVHKNLIDSFSLSLDASRSTLQDVEPQDASQDDLSRVRPPPESPSLPSAETSKDQLQPFDNFNNDDDDDACAYHYDAEEEDRNDMEVDPPDQNEEEEKREEEEEEDGFDDPTTMDNEELTEEAEESRWNKKSQQMLHTFNRLLSRKDQVSLKEILSKCNRKQVASKFYSLLVLKKTQMVNVYQDKPYSDIIITRGPQFAPMG